MKKGKKMGNLNLMIIVSTILVSLFIATNLSLAQEVRPIIIPIGSSKNDTPQEVLDKILKVDGTGSGLDADNLDGRDGSYYVDWNNIINIPAGFADGVDDGAGSGGGISGVAAGTGLTGGGTSGTVTLNANTTYLQRRVISACLPGYSIRAISTTGGVTCEIDDNSGGDITGITAGTGLNGGGATGDVTVAADTTYLQRRISSSCAAGSSIRSISSTGTVTCEADSIGGDITGVTAGTGLSGGGTNGTVTLNAEIPFRLSSSILGGVIEATNSLSGGSGYGIHGNALGSYGIGLYGQAEGTGANGVRGYAIGTDGVGVYASSILGDGLVARTSSSSKHAGEFWSNASSGLNGAVLYAHTNNSTGNGISFWAHNDSSNSSDTTVLISNDGSGPILKGYGGNGGDEEVRINNDGTVKLYNSSHVEVIRLEPSTGRTITQVLQITGGSDLSERFNVDKHLNPEPGMLVSIDPVNPGKLQVSNSAYDTKVAGIISGAGGINTGMMMGQENTLADGAFPVALTGRVYCLADSSLGAIKPGDLLTTSERPGHAMKVANHDRATGAIIGKAMTPLDNGEGLVLVLVSLQ